MGISGKNYLEFQEKLRGTTGYKAVIMPTPSLAKFMVSGITPPPSTPPDAQPSTRLTSTQQSFTDATSKRGHESTQSSSFQPQMRETRLYKQSTSFKLRNTKDDPVTLAKRMI